MNKDMKSIGLKRASLILSVLICVSSATVHAATGDLDLSFSNDGRITGDFISGTPGSSYAATAIQGDGKIVAVGSVFNQPRYLYASRYYSDGSPDPTFGEGGQVRFQFGGFYNYIYDLAIQPDGKIVIAGCYCEEDLGGYTLAVARLYPNGELDTTFDGDGVLLRPDLAGPASAVAIQPDGKIVVAGQVGFNLDWIVLRLNANGSQDSSFAVISNVLAPRHGMPWDAAIQSDGKIVVAGGDNRSILVRYTTNGQLDSEFDGDGIAASSEAGLGYSTVKIQTDGKIIAVGSSIVRYMPNGSLDMTFDGDGILARPVNTFTIQADGKIIAVSNLENGSNSDFGIVRLQPDGALDLSFAGDGTANIDFNGSEDYPYGIALDHNGRAVVVGQSDQRFAIARIITNASLRRNGKIAFTSDRDGNREIYLMDADGSNQTRLTNNSSIDDFPTWSPDGTKIAFLGTKSAGVYAIFTMNADGSNRTEVTSVNYQPPSPWSGYDWRHMSWSPDGSRIAFTELISGSGNLMVVNADGSDRRQLTTGFYPAWSPDGSKILFIKASTPNPFYNLHTIRPDGTGLHFIATSFPNYYILWDAPPIWSPDGLKIMVNLSDAANAELNILNADGTNPQFFVGLCAYSMRGEAPTGCGANWGAPTWSPDGNKVAFAQFDFTSRTTEIYSKTIGGSAETALTQSIGSNSNPSWQSLPPVFSITGRVTSPTGQPLRNVVVTMTDPQGGRRSATTSTFGVYSFTNIPLAGVFTISATSKRYRFTPRVVDVNGPLSSVDLTGLE
jgi:uncharacterized delta-60 repeat protein